MNSNVRQKPMPLRNETYHDESLPGIVSAFMTKIKFSMLLQQIYYKYFLYPSIRKGLAIKAYKKCWKLIRWIPNENRNLPSEKKAKAFKRIFRLSENYATQHAVKV